MADQHESERQYPRRAAIGRDRFDAEDSRGFINQPSGPIDQAFIEQQIIQSGPPTRRPTCPSPNAPVLFGRETIRNEIIGRLRHDAGTLAINAVRGLPGIGKTDLLRAIGGDPQITAHFAGGVLYAELGPTPDRSQIMRRWITEMGMEPPRSDEPMLLAGVVRAALAGRPALLILDDVWAESLDAALALRECAAPGCCALASSRSREVARELAQTEPLVLEVLNPPAALELLRQHAGAVIDADEPGAQTLAAALGYLPLALKLAGRLLANDRRNAHPCAALLTTWRTRLDQLRGHERRPGRPPTTDHRPPTTESGELQGRGTAGDGQLSLDAIVGMSYDALPDDATRTAAAALAAFGAMPLDFDWDAMVAVWGAVDPTQKRPGRFRAWLAKITGQKLERPAHPDLTERWENAILASGLLEFDEETRRYSLHQVVQAFFAARARPEVYERHAAYYAAMMERYDKEIEHETTIDNALVILDREIGQMELGQQYAANAEPTSFWDAQLIDYAFACHDYFYLRGRYEQKIEWGEAGRRAAQRRGKDTYVARLLNNFAISYEATGHYDKAIAHYQQSLEISRRISDVAGTGNTLGNLGNVYRKQGHYDEAIAHCQQSLEIFQRIGDVAGTGTILGNLGVVYYQQGHYDEAIAHCQQSLEIKRRIGDIVGTARTLNNLGMVYRQQGYYDEAIAHYQQSLEIKRRIGDVAGTARTLWNLGTLYEEQGNLLDALPLMEQCVEWEERIGHPDAAEDRARMEQLRARINGDGAVKPPADEIGDGHGEEQ